MVADYVRQYYTEAMYQLCNGFAINSGYYTLYMNIGGVFRSPKGGHDPGNHPVGFRVRIGSILKRLAKLVQIEVDGDEPDG